jgi:hypothetical protein
MPVPNVDNNVTLALMIAISVLLLAWLLVYMTKRVIIGTQTSVLLTNDVVPLNSPNYTTLTTSNMPASINGNTYTYMFWLKLTYFNASTTHKVLWFRSSNTRDALGVPIVMLDARSNRMYVLLTTNLTPAGLTFDDITGLRIEDLRGVLRFAVATIDYVPMSRWTHIGIIVNDRYVQLTLDGNLYSSGTVDNYASVAGASAATNVRAVIQPASGTIYMGGQPDIEGQMTRLQFANYPMLVKDIKKVYDALPTGSTGLGALGLPKYGLRNPFYKIT